MKPAPFTYHAPTTIEQALELLASEPDARVLAGGQSLVPRMRLRVEKPATIIDINRVVGLDGISVDAGAVTVGALVRQQTLVTHDGVAAVHPLLREAGSYAGFHTTRHRGTVGGSIAFAAPWAELAATTTLLGATITVRSTKAQRTLAASDFFRGPNETALAADELVTEVQFPAAPAGAGFGFFFRNRFFGSGLLLEWRCGVANKKLGRPNADFVQDTHRYQKCQHRNRIRRGH